MFWIRFFQKVISFWWQEKCGLNVHMSVFWLMIRSMSQWTAILQITLIIHVFSVRRWVIPDCIVFFHMGTVKDKRYIALIRHAALIWGQSIRIHCISRTTQYSVINKRKSGQIYSRISIIHALRFTFATWTKLGPYRRYYSRMILPENQIKQSGPH